MEYESQLNEFLYPIYFKLLLIYQLDYNIPDKIYDDELNYSGSDSDSSMI